MIVNHEPIQWSALLETGVDQIDEQHQILVNMLNDANTRLTSGSGRDILEEIVHDLMSYALYHFDTEEELMIDCGYDDAQKQQHFEEHRQFSAKVSQVQQAIKQGNLISREDLLCFLNNWLVNHILKTDKQLGSFLTPVNGSQ